MPEDLNTPQPSTVQPLARAIITNLHRWEQAPKYSDEDIQLLRDALKTCPQEASLALAGALLTRFVFETHSTDDCEEAVAVLDNLIASTTPGDGADSFHAQASEMIAFLTLARSIFYSDPEYSEQAILRCRAALSFSTLDDHLRVVLTQALAIHAEQRFKYFGLADGLHEAGSLVPEIVNLLSPGEGAGGLYASRRAYTIATVVEKIQFLEELLPGTTTGSLHHRTYVEDLSCWYDTKFSRTGDLSDLEMAITYRRMLLTPPQSNHPLSFIPLGFLCDDLLIAFEHTRSMGYLDEAIIHQRNLLTMQDAQTLYFALIRRLVLSLCVRFRLLAGRQDLDEIMQLCPIAVDDKCANVADRFKFSCLWASLARHYRHPCVSTAYESAMSLMQPSLAFAPIVQVQQARLVGMGEPCERMPLDYASYQIDASDLEQAIETLERGRARLWTEMRSFRSEEQQLIISDVSLAQKFTAVNYELEGLTISAKLGGDTDVDPSAIGGREGGRMDPFCRLVMKQRKLLKERDTLVSHIRSLPGLGNFFTPPSFDTLRSATSHGPVIIINHTRWRSDILILHDGPPSLITTHPDFYDRANRLKDQILSSRRGYGSVLGSAERASAVRIVLADLYALVGRLVIEKLRELGIPEQSRVWWCPTSAFCFLPLHAMGPIPSRNKKVEQYFSDLYISSYTSTLSALIDSRKPAASHTADRPSILLVAHHDDNLRGMRKEIKAIQGLRHTQVKSLTASSATTAAAIEGLRHHRFVHLAGSVKLEQGRPLDAPFRLYGGDRLTLLDIARCRLPDAEFAYLSASHTAELTGESIPDEVLHLTAAMLHCGFRSVVGTMWGMADGDGKHVCKHFYKLMFAKNKAQEGVPYHERAAKALRDAVQKLRKKKGVTTDRWVTYVHYGA
ncbi:CHAT domain-containing protein [Russula compacta]|nr:CHAT domain-containing protein [Russula compacta]